MQLRRTRGEFGALVHGAHVVPEDRRAQDVVAGVEQHGAMHLPGKADAAHLREFLRMGFAQRGERAARAVPPVGGILLGPARVRARDDERRAGRANHAAVGREQQDFHFGGAEVDAEIHRRAEVLMRVALL